MYGNWGKQQRKWHYEKQNDKKDLPDGSDGPRSSTSLRRISTCRATRGYTHVGDGFLYLAASLLPAPYAAAAGAIGAGLADLLSVYSIWAPGTIIIKALTALCFTNKLDKLVNKRNVLGIIPALVLCVGGYYLYEAIITGNFAAPALGIPGYLTQVALSSVVYLALGAALVRAGTQKEIGGNLI